MNPLHTDLPVVNLRPGEVYVAREPTLITTILGSCVAVSLYCPTMRMGAMCHGVMPGRRGVTQEESFRFVDSSISYIIDTFLGHAGVDRSKIVVKLFGGADVIGKTARHEDAAPTIGAQNIVSAKNTILRYGLPISVEKVGGIKGYKLFFYSHTGEILLKYLAKHHDMGRSSIWQRK